jgi:hypothetical protein
MRVGQFVLLRTPLIIPHPTYICSLVLTASVSIGYCYIFVSQIILLNSFMKAYANVNTIFLKVYKLALYPCDRAVEAQDVGHMALDSVLRLTIALYSLVSFIYIMQR